MKNQGPKGEVVDVIIGGPCECTHCKECRDRQLALAKTSPFAGKYRTWKQSRIERGLNKLPRHVVRQPANS